MPCPLSAASESSLHCWIQLSSDPRFMTGMEKGSLKEIATEGAGPGLWPDLQLPHPGFSLSLLLGSKRHMSGVWGPS